DDLADGPPVLRLWSTPRAGFRRLRIDVHREELPIRVKGNRQLVHETRESGPVRCVEILVIQVDAVVPLGDGELNEALDVDRRESRVGDDSTHECAVPDA